ncbi:DUF2147 domain-containing protein [Francisellaceae bacterium]|nr:DUF2147 domain-containing protein [Francisellaceae bacterium]
MMKRFLTTLLAIVVANSQAVASDNEIITRVSNVYENNPVLHNEVQAIPGQARWLDQGHSGVKDQVLNGNSYWATFTINQVNNQYLIQSIVGITADENNNVKGGILLPFVNVINGKPVPPILSCQDCSGKLKHQAIVGLPLLQARLSKYKQYHGEITNPIDGKNYDLIMWVDRNNSELHINAGNLFTERPDKIWYKVSNSLAKQCFEWFNKQPFAKKQLTENKEAVKSFKSYKVVGANPTSESLTHQLENLCQ